MFTGDFWTNFWANALATLGLGFAGWVATRVYARWELHRRPGRIAFAFDGSSEQFKRYQTIEKYQLTRVYFVVGVINRTAHELKGVQCFVLGVREDRRIGERRPLQPVGEPKGSERVNIPPSTTDQPTAYFELAEMYLRNDEPEASSDMAWLCVTYGENMLGFSSHVRISLEGEGFALEEWFHVFTRTNGYHDEAGKWHGPGMVGLNVTRQQ